MSPVFCTYLASASSLLYTVISYPFNVIVEPFIPEFLDVNILCQDSVAPSDILSSP
nr:MAG TPA: hypothetical protein [Bacteriophage sp.]